MINSNLDSSHMQGDGMLCPAEVRECEVMGESEAEGAKQEGEEARELRAPTIPMTPSRAEVLQHRL